MKRAYVALFYWLLTGISLPAADSAYPLKIHPDRRHLADRSGNPFLLQGDAAWSLISGLTKEQVELYLEDRRQKGFNTLMVNLIEHKFKGPENRYGALPFPAGDFSAPNETYFAHADWVIQRAGEKQMQVLLAPIYLGYRGTDEGWYEETLRNGPLKCREYGRYVGRRYGKFNNVLWLIGGDRNPGEALDSVNAVAAGIKEVDQRHLFTAHCAPEASAIDEYATGHWLDLNVTYSYEIVHRHLVADYNRSPVMPFFLIESTYEGEHNATGVQIRRQAYWAILCGATGQIMGNRPMWLFDPGWQKALDSPASQDMVFLKSLFLSRPWHRLVPDQRHEVVVDGVGELRGLDTLTAALTDDRATLMAYLPTQRAITVDMTKISGTRANAWWFNPRSGQTTSSGELVTEGKKQFLPPGDGDWVLIVDDSAKGLSAPGAGARMQSARPEHCPGSRSSARHSPSTDEKRDLIEAVVMCCQPQVQPSPGERNA